MIKPRIALTSLAALVTSCSIVLADCTHADLVDTSADLVSRMDAMAACIAQQGETIARQNLRIARLESTVLISEVPCPDLGEGWQLYAPGDGRFFIGAGSRYEFGQQGGKEKVSLSVQQMPSHGHPGSKIEPSQAVMQNLDVEPGRKVVNTPHHDRYVEISPNGIPVSIASAGGGAVHENMPPYVAMYFCKFGS